MYTWIIEKKIAQAPLPSLSDIPILSRSFTGVIVLTTPREHSSIYIDRLIGNGVEVLYIPTPDHHPVELLDLLRAIAFVEKHLRGSGSVLVHCYGGIGRSGLVSASYLVYKGLGVYEAVRYVRERVPGAIENQWQLQMLENLSTLLNVLGGSIRDDYIRLVAEVYDYDRVAYLHLSKTIQFTIEIANNVDLLESGRDRRDIITSSIAHVHRDELRSRIVNSLRLGELEEDIVVELSHLLDHSMDARVVVLNIRDQGNYLDFQLLCREDCSDINSLVKKKYEENTFIFNKKAHFTWDYYLSYI